jgi:predicted nuclease of predicted toxin-antitoxin system
VRFLIDAQLPPALATWLAGQGYSATAVREVGLRDSDDGTIFNFAEKGGWILVTKDEDFMERCLNSSSKPKVVWLRIGNCTNQVLFSWLQPFIPQIIEKLKDGETIVEVRRYGVSS